MNRIQTDGKLQPAFEYALLVLDSKLIDATLPRGLHSVDGTIFEQGFFQLYRSTLRTGAQLPAGDDWKWNQTKGRKNAFLVGHNTRVTFKKLIPRPKSKETPTKLPPYKLWVFNLHHPTAGEFTAIWCECGKVSDKTQAMPTLEDYEFLAEFMSPEDAIQLWPSYARNTPSPSFASDVELSTRTTKPMRTGRFSSF